MSSVVVEYPSGLPAPTVGEVRPTERRSISSVGQMRNTRAIQRDRHGTRTVAFTFTPEQAAIFREWWVEWLKLGGGWFAANWPLPWSRGPNVFRFTDPPQWQLIGGRLNGEGYWQVRATCEIRGRGMLPAAEVLYFTSMLYPVYTYDNLGISVNSDDISSQGTPIDALGISVDLTGFEVWDQVIYRVPIGDNLGISVEVDEFLSHGQITHFVTSSDHLAITTDIMEFTAWPAPIINYNNYRPEALKISVEISEFEAWS